MLRLRRPAAPGRRHRPRCIALPKGVTTRLGLGEDDPEARRARPGWPGCPGRPGGQLLPAQRRRVRRSRWAPVGRRVGVGLRLGRVRQVEGLGPAARRRGRAGRAPSPVPGRRWACAAARRRCCAVVRRPAWLIIRVWARNFWTARVELPRVRHVALEGRGEPRVGDDRGGAAADRPGRGRGVGQAAGLPEAVAAGDHVVRRRPRWRHRRSTESMAPSDRPGEVRGRLDVQDGLHGRGRPRRWRS